MLPPFFVLAVTGAALPPDVFYHALLGRPEVVEATELVDTPGSHVGHAVRTRGRLERSDTKGAPFHITAGKTARLLLRLEPETAAVVRAQATSWLGQTVEVEGFFYRDPDVAPADAHALRAWKVVALQDLGEHPTGESAPLISLEALVYGAGRYDGTAVRVRGVHRGPNLHRDLPEVTRRSYGDWVLKDGYFAAWVGGAELRGNDRTAEAGVPVEVLGVPSTVNGVVRIVARQVVTSLEPVLTSVGSVLLGSPDWAAMSPRVVFSYPVPGQALDPDGHMIVQFNKPMDPERFELGVRVRFERGRVASEIPRVKLQYRDRCRALVITPEPPPPPGTDVVVELLEVLLDAGGRRLARSGSADQSADPGGPVVERIRFRGGP